MIIFKIAENTVPNKNGRTYDRDVWMSIVSAGEKNIIPETEQQMTLGNRIGVAKALFMSSEDSYSVIAVAKSLPKYQDNLKDKTFYLVPAGMGVLEADGSVKDYHLEYWNLTTEKIFEGSEPVIFLNK